jgi:gamma-glutamyltranspeptidase/glutathione hydrolase
VDEFYRGEVGAELAAYMSEVGGLITTDDLAAYQPRWLEPYVQETHPHPRP